MGTPQPFLLPAMETGAQSARPSEPADSATFRAEREQVTVRFRHWSFPREASPKQPMERPQPDRWVEEPATVMRG